MSVNIDQALDYTNPSVIKRFSIAFNKSIEDSEVIFSDLMKFFWGSEKHAQDKLKSDSEELDFVYIMDEEMRPIDDMWHIFLLFTKDYMDFCEKYFGQYIHHLPDIVPGLEPGETNFELNLSRFLNYNYDILGHETISRWFGESV